MKKSGLKAVVAAAAIVLGCGAQAMALPPGCNSSGCTDEISKLVVDSNGTEAMVYVQIEGYLLAQSTITTCTMAGGSRQYFRLRGSNPAYAQIFAVLNRRTTASERNRVGFRVVADPGDRICNIAYVTADWPADPE